MNIINKTNILSVLSIVIISMLTISCNDGKSYAELLDEETAAINRYLADQRVIGHVPADSIFEVGENAPFYKMDEDGNVYMRVIETGDMNNRAEYDDVIGFFFTRYDLDEYVNGTLPPGSGNANDLMYSLSFRYKNYNSSGSSEWGSGIQLPLNYLGNGCNVDLVIRSQYGPSSEISTVVPFLYNVRYYKTQL